MRLIFLILLLGESTILAFAQPDELYRKRYKEPGMTYGNPYTTFNRRKPNWSLASDLKIIRDRLIAFNGSATLSTYALAYAELYNSAFASEPSNSGHAGSSTGSPHAVWTKNNAIIWLVGVKYYKDSSNNNRFILVDSLSEVEKNDFNSFRDHAILGLKRLNTNVVACIIGGEEGCKYLLGRSRELTQYIQAYDLLKACGALPPYDQDRNEEGSPRNKLREFARNVYTNADEVLNSRTGWKRNHGIAVASSIGLAAIVLNDAGTETNILKGAFGWLWGDGFVIPRPDYSPVNWMKRAHGDGGRTLKIGMLTWGEDGIEDVFFKGKMGILRPNNIPMTNEHGTSGYTEGPGYFNYALECFLPYMRAMDNFVPEWNSKNYVRQEKYQNMLKWSQGIMDYDQSLPTYDNSRPNIGNVLGLLGMEEYPGNGLYISKDVMDLRGDYILSMAPEKPEIKEFYQNDESGNIKISMQADNHSHTFYMLYEYGIANEIGRTVELSHEDDDMGSFFIKADGYHLAIDPPYIGFDDAARTNKYNMHNTLDAYNLNEFVKNIPYRPSIHDKLQSLNKKAFSLTIPLPDDEFINRHVQMINTHGNVYYLLNDKIYTPSNPSFYSKIRLNGNGLASDNTFKQFDSTGANNSNGNWFKWTHLCDNSIANSWNLLAHSAVMNPPATPVYVTSNNDNEHHVGTLLNVETGGYAITKYVSSSNDGSPVGKHSKMEVSQQSGQTIFQTFIFPYQCNTSLPLINKMEGTDYVTTTVRFLFPIDTTVVLRNMYKSGSPNLIDTTAEFHFARYTKEHSVIGDPFKLGDPLKTLTTDAPVVFMSRSTYSKPGSGACASSKVHFNKASVSNGTYLTYDDTTYIFAGVPLDAHYEIIDKFKYEGYIDPLGGSATVRFYLPDAEPGYEMKATGKYVIGQNYYADSFKIDVTVSQPGEFIIELADPCQADCFFPPNTAPIDSLFVFETGTTEVLGHDLDIVQDKGEMHITKGSKMSICEQFVFANKDSLLLSNVEGNEVFAVTNIMDGPGTVTNRVVARLMSKRSMIIVNNKAALVLDSGSFTHVGDNSTILIRKGGTLLVRRGAILEIGGNEGSGPFAFGEVIAEEGSYVCIEDGSDIHFFADTGWVDTFDNNIFFVNLNAYLPTVAGVNTLGGRGKFAGDSIYGGSECRAFCDVKIYHPPHGVNNREYGWCNFSEPVSMFYMRDTMCEYEQPVIKGKRSLNETWHRAEMRHNGSLLYSKESHPDSARVDEIKMPAFPGPGAYSFTLIARNDCAETDTLVRNVIVPDSAYAVFTLSDTSICNGTGNLTVNGTASVSNLSTVKHLWFVQRIDTVGGDSLSPVFTTEDYSQEWLFDKAAVDSNFSFPDFYWQGGHRYAVGLTVFGFCNDSTYTDTINVPLSAGISVAARPGVFSDPLGPSALQLNAWVRGASSWSWSPTTGLFPSNSLTPLATPDNDVTYVLTAVNGSCTAKDSVIIKRTHFTYAGDSRIICDGEGTVLGSRYVLATILAMSGGAHYAELEQLAAFDQKRLSALLMEHHVIDLDDIGACASLSYLSPEQSDFTEKMLDYSGFSTYFSAYMGPHDVNVHYDFYNELMLDPYFSSVLSQVDNDACFGDFLQDLITLYTNCGNYNMVNDVSKTSAFILGAMYAADSSSFGEIWEELNEGDLHFPSYLDGFIQSAEFASIPCLSITELPLSYDEQTLLEDPSFMIYYDSLISDPRSKNAFQLFVDQYIGSHGSDVADDILADAEGYATCFEMLKVNYIEWLNNQDPSCVSKRLVTWEKMETGSNWLHLRNWNDHYNIIDTPLVKTDYRITVIDIANNIVEHDIVTISIDTAPVPLFYPTYQTDSTLYFTNYTASANSISYEWTFGDGSPATHSTHAIHTFSAMDSSYLVCLKATNACGSYTTCDTFTVDTNGVLLYGGMGKKGRDVVRFEEPAVTEKVQQLPDQHLLSFNRPNPFSEITAIDYAVKQPYHSVSMRVTNTLGQLMYDVSLPAMKGTILFDASEMRRGMYYYSLVVDGVPVKTHTMVVDR